MACSNHLNVFIFTLLAMVKRIFSLNFLDSFVYGITTVAVPLLMLERGISVMPEPFQNLDRALVVAQQAVLRASADGVPEGRIDLVREFIYAVEALLQRAAAAAQPQVPSSPGAGPVQPTPAAQPAPAM